MAVSIATSRAVWLIVGLALFLALWQLPQRFQGTPAAFAALGRPLITPQPVIMLMIGRTGSSVAVDILNRHPDILFMGELFNFPSAWDPGAQVEGFFSHGEYSKRYEFWLGKTAWRDSVPAKQYDRLRWVGLKVNTHVAQFAAGSPHWDMLASLQPKPKVICLQRLSDVKAVISEQRAYALAAKCKSHSKVVGSNCSIPTEWSIGANVFQASLAARLNMSQRHLDVCHLAAEKYHTLFVNYEELVDTAGLSRSTERMLSFLGLPPNERSSLVEGIQDGSLPIAFEKTTPDDLRTSLTNVDELVAVARSMYADTAERLFH